MNAKYFLIILPHYIKEESIGNQDIIQIGEKVSNSYKKYEMYNVLISVYLEGLIMELWQKISEPESFLNLGKK